MSKAAARRTMTDVGFEWQPKGDQTFSDPGQTVTEPPQNFGKLAGYRFTMDSSEQTLTLQVNDASETFWGEGGLAFPPPSENTIIEALNGAFAFKSGGPLQLSFFEPRTPTHLRVDNSAKITIDGPPTLQAFGALVMDAKTKGTLDIKCGKIDLTQGPSVSITAQDSARISMTASSTFGMAKAIISVFSSATTGPDEYALKLASTGDVLTLTNSQLTFSGRPKGLLRSTGLILTNTSIQASGDAICFFQSGEIFPTNGAQFALRGKAQMKFDSFSSGEAGPFDFIGGKGYDKGLFAFNNASSSTDNSGFVIRVTLFSEAKKAILTQQLVSVDGKPQGNENLINITQSGDYLVIKLK